ncbi:outer membrane beta-barrel protein [uncultured Algimonas sp.]|uniref:outer membrane beta-barrel protein n=1 Tax=uncultured Algimonas sp. TaxID=1547920 RepID=UPI002612B231|nr:outer membrane beta-barrel protein [uncultured Algimonas sp.]
MRLLAYGISVLALGGCSYGGVGFGQSQSGWQGPAAPLGAVCGYDPCAAPAPLPVVYAPPPPPVAPVPASPCHVDPCAATYAVAPYGGPQPLKHHTHIRPAYPGGYGLRGGFAPQPAYAYGTLGAVYYDPDQPYAGLQGRIGYQSASFFGAEVEGSVGVIGDSDRFATINGSAVPGEIEDAVDHSIAAFATGRVPLGQGVSAHARLGYHNTKTSRDFEFDNGDRFETSDTRVGVAYGAGLQYDLTPLDGVRFDYTRYEGGDNGLDSLSLAYLRRF